MHRMRIRAKGVKIYAFLKNTHIKRVFFALLPRPLVLSVRQRLFLYVKGDENLWKQELPLSA